MHELLNLNYRLYVIKFLFYSCYETPKIIKFCLLVVSWNASPSSKSRDDGFPVLQMYQKKRTPNVNVCAKIHFQINISDLSTSTNPKKARFSSNSIFCQSSNEALKSEMFISTVHFGTSVDVERMFFLVRFRHWDPTNPRFGRRCSISYMRKKIERRPVSKIVAIFIAVQNWTWWFFGFTAAYKTITIMLT